MAAPEPESPVSFADSDQAEVVASMRLLLVQALTAAEAQRHDPEAAPVVDAAQLAEEVLAALALAPDEPRERLCTVCEQVGALIANLTKPFGEMLEHTLYAALAAAPSRAAKLLELATRVPAPFVENPTPRQRVLGLYYKTLVRANAAGPRVPDSQVRALAHELERGVYNWTIETSEHVCLWENIEFLALYAGRASLLKRHLDPRSSVSRAHGLTLAADLLADPSSAAELGWRNAEELCPAGFLEERSTIALRSQQTVKKKTSSMWACPQCHARSSIYWEVQDRAADEPASIYCACTVCDHQYKAA